MQSNPDTSTARLFTVATAIATLLFVIWEVLSAPHAAVEMFVIPPLLLLAWMKAIRLGQEASAGGADQSASRAALTLGRSLLLAAQICFLAICAWIFGSALNLF